MIGMSKLSLCSGIGGLDLAARREEKEIKKEMREISELKAERSGKDAE